MENTKKSLYKILIVDDDPVIEELLTVNFKTKGYNIFSAKDGSEALQKINTVKPDLILLDVMMPHIDGWEICKIIRDSEELSGMKIIMLTAKDTNRDKMIGKLIFKADEYITKPFDIDFLIQTAEKLLNETK